MNSLKVSLDVSWQALLKRNNKDTAKFFSLVGLLPSGVTDEDFERIWGKGWIKHKDILLRSSLLLKSPKDNEFLYRLYPFMMKYAEERLTKYFEIFFYDFLFCLNYL